MPRRVREHNAAVGQEISLKLRALRSGSEGSTAALQAATKKPSKGQTGRKLAAAAGGAAVGEGDGGEGDGEEGGLADTLGALLDDDDDDE